MVHYRRQSLASNGWGKESFRGHIANDTLGKTLATAQPRGIFLVGAGPLASLLSRALSWLEMKLQGCFHETRKFNRGDYITQQDGNSLGGMVCHYTKYVAYGSSAMVTRLRDISRAPLKPQVSVNGDAPSNVNHTMRK